MTSNENLLRLGWKIIGEVEIRIQINQNSKELHATYSNVDDYEKLNDETMHNENGEESQNEKESDDKAKS